MGMGAATPSRALRAGALALLLGSLVVFAERCVRDPAIPYLFLSDSAPWMGFPQSPDGMLGLSKRDALPLTVFVRSFALAEPVAHAQLHVRALRHFRVRIDGQPLGLSETRHWRSFQRLWLPALGARSPTRPGRASWQCAPPGYRWLSPGPRAGR